jgi:hypothetical protein
MKIQIDTTEKTIKVELPVNMGELETELEKLLPNWKEYTLIKEPEYVPYMPIPYLFPSYSTPRTWVISANYDRI